MRVVEARASGFDVICAGEALWTLAEPRSIAPARAGAFRFRAGGAAATAAVTLARWGLRVGLAATMWDDAAGRALTAKVAANGVDVGGIALTARTGVLLVETTTRGLRVVASRAEDVLPVEVPAGWSSQVLLLSGISPALAHAAGLCKAARAARRAGTIVVVDVNARWRIWAGFDARASRALLHEADVVRCSTEDLAVLGLDPAGMRAAMHPSAVLVRTDGAGAARASGPFGEVARAPRRVAVVKEAGAGDLFTAAICAELARAGDPGAHREDFWDRALLRGHEAAEARAPQGFVDAGRVG